MHDLRSRYKTVSRELDKFEEKEWVQIKGQLISDKLGTVKSGQRYEQQAKEV